MKYHIGVKFLAIFLCAACLLGAVASGAGMIVLSELDLYNHTVEEVLEREIQSSGRSFARQAALYYASEELGGCPDELVSQRYVNQWHNSYYAAGDYGYVIRDAEGNVVAGSNAELAQTGKRYSFPVTGQYMHLVSLESADNSERGDTSSLRDSDNPLGGAYGVYDVIPQYGVEIYGITVGCGGENPSREGHGGIDSLGVLSHGTGAGAQSVIFQFADGMEAGMMADWQSSGEVDYIAFQDESGQVVYELSVPSGDSIVWDFNFSEGRFSMTPSLGGGGSENTLTDVCLAEFYSLSDPEQVVFRISSEGAVGDMQAIGDMHYDANGGLVVSIPSLTGNGVKSAGVISEGWVSGVRLYDGSGALIAEDTGNGSVTIAQDGMLYYHTAPEGTLVPTASSEAIPAEGTPPEDGVPEEAPEAQPEDGGEAGNPEDGQADAGEEPAEPEDAAEGEPLTEDGQPAPEEQPQTDEENGKGAEAPEQIEATAVTAPPETEPVMLPQETKPALSTEETKEAFQYEMVEVTEPVTLNGKRLSDYEINHDTFWDRSTGETMRAEFVYVPLPDYTVELYVTENNVTYSAVASMLTALRNMRSDLMLILGGCLLLFALCAVYLCCAAGHGPGQTEVKAGGLCRMPLDLNLGLTALAIAGCVCAAVYGAGRILMASLETGCMAAGGLTFLASLSLVQFLYCAVAQFKTPGGYWWRNSLCGRIVMGAWKLLAWMVKYLPEKLGKLAIFLWNLVTGILRFLWRNVAVKAVSAIGGGIRKFVELLPLMWQWVLVGAGLIFLDIIFVVGISSVIAAIALNLAVVLYVAYCFGILLKSAKKMGKGDLNTKVDDKHMVGCFKEFAGDLNDLAGVAVVAAQKQLKSERMKTELITNVSHDIKTPLTSIINYVDLLQKPHTEEEEAMYLEVLARQSQRLKKLIEDLMDMSKASTGNMNVDITTLDAVEAVNQALGEFADKLDKADLIPVFRHGKDSVPMRGDGKLVWRVLSNLLGNAVKYAMPGTRLYIDLVEMEGNVIISLKNISREELNVDSEELMERFVRGDDSRNTEGSGLGLNIAKSLMELQKGQLQLLVDGDLFKVTLVFPGV